MGLKIKRTALEMGLVALMGLTLVVLAFLQYRWIGDVGQAERARLKASLDNAIRQCRTEFNSELRRLCIAFEPEPEVLATHDWDRLIAHYDDWKKEDRHTKLVEDVFLLTTRSNGETESLWLDDQAGQWLPSNLPQRLIPIRGYLDRRRPWPPPGPGAARMPPWQALPAEFVLIEGMPAPQWAPDVPEAAAFLILALDPRYFKEVFLAEIIQRHFGDHPETGLEAAVILGTEQPTVLCSSDPQPAAGLIAVPDVRARLLWDRSDPVPMDSEAPPPSRRSPPARRNWGAPVVLGSDTGEWEIVARFRGGSLEEIVGKSRRRSLAVSFGVLVLLGVGMTVIFLGARRSHQLAELQMRFVAGVSHDLRTPLAVICSAADNLADGVFEAGSSRIREYGALIRSEGRKLSSMVEQILQYASLKSSIRKPGLQPIVVRDLIEALVADERALASSAGITMQTDVPADLPPVLGNLSALQQALRNLVSNSIKHAASGRWIGIRALRVAASDNHEIAITVEDRGPGIPAGELSHIFEPFYRGQSAIASGAPGNGLGLSVVKQSVDGMGGHVSVSSTPGQGSIFTICLPSASPASAPTDSTNEGDRQ